MRGESKVKGKRYQKPRLNSRGPRCGLCKWSREIPGDAHLQCVHPETMKNEAARAEFAVLGMLASIGRVPSIPIGGPSKKLGIKAKRAGVCGGWFNWPMNFDPIWLEACNGFEFIE